MKLASFLGLCAALLAAPAVTAQTCAFASFGRPCGGVLTGSQVRQNGFPAARFDLGAAAPNSVAVLVAGSRARAVALPQTNCPLLVTVRATMLQTVDPNGAAQWTLRLPAAAVPFAIDLQVVTLQLNRNGRYVESTNGLTMTCR